MEWVTLELLYMFKRYADIRRWVVTQSQLESSNGSSISFKLLCAALLLRMDELNNIKIDNNYLHTRANERNFYGKTVWHYLAESGNTEALIRAIDAGKFNPETLKDDNGETVWHYLGKEYVAAWEELNKAGVEDIQRIVKEAVYPDMCFVFLKGKLKNAIADGNEQDILCYQAALWSHTIYALEQQREHPLLIMFIINADKYRYFTVKMHDIELDVNLKKELIRQLIKYQPQNVRLIESLSLVLRVEGVDIKNHFTWLWHNRALACDSFSHMWSREIKDLEKNALKIQHAYRSYALLKEKPSPNSTRVGSQQKRFCPSL